MDTTVVNTSIFTYLDFKSALNIPAKPKIKKSKFTHPQVHSSQMHCSFSGGL